MTLVKIKKLHPDAILPQYAHTGDAGADLFSIEDFTLAPMARAAIGTGLAAEVAIGFEIQIRPKSGLALSAGIAIVNAPGTVDAGYRGEIKVIFINLGREPYNITKGQKIAQAIISPVIRAEFTEVTELSSSQRDTGGFGSTGV
jgi:dUTP pyrophosphatase